MRIFISGPEIVLEYSTTQCCVQQNVILDNDVQYHTGSGAWLGVFLCPHFVVSSNLLNPETLIGN